MQISDIQSFLQYYSKIKARTSRLFAYIPPDKMEWAPSPNQFTFGDLIRHLANIERYMYAETVQGRSSIYSGCGTAFAAGYEATCTYYHAKHQESIAIFEQLSENSLSSKCMTPGGTPITVWKWLRAMVEHEVHHRGQLYTYLGILGIKTPPMFGMTSEEVAAASPNQSNS